MNNKPYHNEDFEDYMDDPKGSQAEAAMFGQKCLPVGINDTFMPTDKSNPDNLNMTQYNLKERFGYLSSEDYENDSDY